MPTRKRNQARKKWSELYRIESNGNEPFKEFQKRMRRLKKLK